MSREEAVLQRPSRKAVRSGQGPSGDIPLSDLTRHPDGQIIASIHTGLEIKSPGAQRSSPVAPNWSQDEQFAGDVNIGE